MGIFAGDRPIIGVLTAIGVEQGVLYGATGTRWAKTTHRSKALSGYGGLPVCSQTWNLVPSASLLPVRSMYHGPLMNQPNRPVDGFVIGAQIWCVSPLQDCR